ncbi:MAG: ABC transporter substrate-binding protein [Chloroflexi bacterium]|nr:ABC transporter substrate-binding protein [Chloroflexota bacterium]
MGESNYWKNVWRKRMTRRRLMGGALLGGGGLATAAIIGCGGGGTTTSGPSVGSTPVTGDGDGTGFRGSDIPIHDARRPFEAPGTTGGTLRFSGFDALVLDTFDPHQTQFGPLYSGHSAAYSKLYKYVSHSEQMLEPDLADGMPEAIGDPPTEFIIKLRRGVRFHDPATLPPDVRDKVAIKDAATKFPGLPGRELTADDVVWSIERQKNLASPRYTLFYRSSQYLTMEKVEKIDDFTVKITTNGPVSPLLHFLADTNAFILPREVVDEGRDTLDFARSDPQSRMIGTGPFVWGELRSLQEISLIRNPDWFGWQDQAAGQGRPFLDGYTSFFIVDDATRESLFRGKKLDVGSFVTNPQWVFDIKDEMPELELLRQTVSGWVNTRFKIFDTETGAPCPLWSDPRLRRAVHLAADRQQVVDFIWSGEAAVTGPVGPVIDKWALLQEELLKIPGYRQGRAERQEDLAMARRLYEEAGSPEMDFVFADQPSYIPDFAPSFIEGLRQNLGPDVKKQVIRAYPQIAEGWLKGCDQMVATWGFDNGWIDLDDWVFPYFKTGGPKNSFGVSDPELDAMLDAQRAEFDEDTRREIGFQIQRYLLGVKPDGSGPLELKPDTAAFARLDYATLITASVSWPYYKNNYTWPWFGNNHWITNQWLDQNDPTFEGRQ